MQTPTAVCQDITVYLNGTGNVSVTAAAVNGGSTDNCIGNLTYTLSNNAFDCDDLGDNNVTLTVKDGNNNSSICVATITVLDNTAPTFTCPAPITVASCYDVVPNVLNGITDEADNCGTVTLTQNPPAGVAFGNVNGGQTTVTVTATDASGNTATCNVTITITDDIDPLISCPSNITVGSDVDKCSAVVTYSIPTATDDCPGLVLTRTSGLASGSIFPGGINTVVYTATDAAGNTASCQITVNVVDQQTPTAVCKDITVNLSNTTNGGTVTVTAAQVNGGSTDNCTPAANLILAPASTTYTCANVGDRLITLTVTDAAGNTSTCVATVTVKDASAPVITTCPANVTVNDCDDVVPAMTNQLVATDNCGVASITQNPVAGTDFGQVSGNSVVVTFTVTDVNGNVSTCTNTITIIDNVNPAFTNCPANITVGNDVDKCGANVFFLAPSASDNCSGVTVARTGGLAAGSLFPVGITTQTYVATDASGNTVSCQFTVTVNDVQTPTAVCKDITVNLSSTTNGGTVTVTAAQINGGSTDNCPASLAYSPLTTTYTCANVGDNNITLTVTDGAGNKSTCVATVTVKDASAPVITTCPANVTVNDCDDVVPSLTGQLVATDNCSVASVTQNPVAGTDFGQVSGNSVIVTFTVTDVNGNTSTCTNTITILDDVKPAFTNCPASISVGNDVDKCGANVFFLAPSATDNCSSVTVTRTTGLAPGSLFPVGTTLETYVATDASGNTVSCTFNVTVTDMQTPTAVCKDITVNLSSTTNGGTVNVTANNINGGSSDNCGGDLTLSPASTTFTCANVGDNLITLTVRDGAGNTSICVATVTVRDVSAPVFTTCPANVTVNDCDDVVPSMTAQLVATDNCCVASVTQNPVAGSDFGQVSGNSVTVTFTVTDVNGNVSTCTNTITILDDVKPAFTNCPANITVGNDVDKCGANVFFLAPSASDNCSGVTVTRTGGLAPGALFPLGITTETYVATDASGNTVSCQFTVTVTDVQTPTAVCKDITVNLSSTTNGGTVTVTAAQINGGSTDNCPATLSYAPLTTTYTCANVGDNNITLTVTDGAGNKSTCVATVTVKDASAPVITTCPANVTVNDCDDVVPSLTGQLVATDNCGVASVTQNPVAGSDFGQVSGNTVTVTFTVTDVNGNVSTCTNTITILDDVKPAFTNCPANITVGNDVDKCGANVFFLAPSASDNCSGVTVTRTGGLAPGELFPLGTTTETYVATDANGNTVSCQFTVTVTDMQAPKAVCKDITVNLSSATNNGSVTVTAAQINGGSTDNCTPAANLVLAPASTTFTCANVGNNNITLTVTDASGNTSTCVATVTVRDVTPPVFTCPAPVTVTSCASTVPNVINGLTATDNCGVASISQNPVAGTDFGQVNGNSVNITVTVTDVNGNVSTCIVVVTIIDNGPPVFVDCPTSMVMIGNDPDQCSGKVNWPTPVALDECLPLANVVQIGGPTPGTVVQISCPPTPTTITYRATDGAGNTAICTFQIMVVDTEKPEFDADILMPGNVTVECDGVPTNCIPRTGGACTPLTVSDVNDNCAGPLTVAFREVSTQNPNPATCGFYTYTLTRTWTITDCADNALIAAGLPPTHQLIHVQVISVRDSKPPTALCKNATVSLDKTGKFILDPQSVNNGSFDNCAAVQFLTFSVNPSQFTCANIGTNLVTLTVTDPCGNAATCQATVTVNEGIGPCTPQFSVVTTCQGNSGMGNATNLDNGQFLDIITIKSLAMQTWTMTSNSNANGQGLYLFNSPAPPASPNLVPVGTLFTAGTADGIDNDGDGATDEADEMIYYTLKALHVDCKGYDIIASNAGGIGMGLSATTTKIQNKACYPTPYFSNLLEDVYCLGTPAFQIQMGEYNNAAGSIVPGSLMVDGVPTNIFDAGSLGLGAHTIMGTFDAGAATQNLVINGIQLGGSMQDAINDPGCKQKITKVINVVETPNALVCNDLVYVSIDDDCTVTMGADDVLEGTYFCYDDYVVEVDKTLPYGNGPWVPAVFNASDIGKKYQYRVRHISGGVNLCWGEIKIEDKLAPILDCPDNITIACSEPTEVSNTGNVVVADCSNYTTVIDDVFADFGECNSPRGQITRTWIVTDVWGNQSSCSQVITITPFELAAVDFPADVTVDCESAYNNAGAIAPNVTGRPSINGAPIGAGGYCSASISFTDEKFDICAGSYTIHRTWKVSNECLLLGVGNPIVQIQRIKVKDFGGPQFVCPPTVTVSSDPFTCCATAALPSMIVSEGCSYISGLEAKVTGTNPTNGNIITFTVPGYLADFPGNNIWNPDTLAVFNYTQCLPLGNYTVQYKAQDQCSNISYCSFVLVVADLVPPTVACDQFTQVALTNNGEAVINASTFDDGSTDNCCLDHFEVARMNPNACSGDQFDSTVKFCCSDIGDTVLVVFRAFDCHGNTNDCMVNVLVEDKIKPVCQSPNPVTVNCENFDPSLWSYGKADVTDNCCLDTNKVYLGQIGMTHTVNYSLFDTVCNKGTITRTFRAFDCAGNSSQCTQRVFVSYLQDYYVKFPNDAIVTVCDGTGNFGEPTFFGEDCELLGVSFIDQIFTVVPDACFKIERTWSIINWCTFNPNLPFIEVPNPNPNAIANNTANLPGPTVSDCGTLPPWKSTVVKINASDAAATDYCSFWNANANGYQYKQIIKIIDGQAPTGTFVAPICDNSNWNTPNSNQLWNEPEWWDNDLQLHDLCEQPTELCITGTDACSGSNVNIEYLLFLDLDNDGTMETVINSVNTGIAGLGWNNVKFNNLNTPNYADGTSRAFDERLVPANQKYGFAIQETVVGNNKTACVRWNTQQQQNTYVTPELPNGTHKIKWLISDGCGNNTEKEYTFTVKDCKAPTVVCLNGLSVNIMPTGMIQLWASDFLQYTEDNCTPTGQIKIGIRKCGTGTGFPVDANGNPITNVAFTCTEVGTQCVELWAIDAAGNADYCETYVIVQDNNGNCPASDKINVVGVLKTEMTEGVEEGIVNIDGTSTFAPPYSYFDLSDGGGIYEVKNNVPLAATFVIAPEKDDNPLNGVTTYDLVLISKHILGIEPLTSPYKMIAADANKSGSITTFDIVELRKLILGLYTELPNNTSWRFVDQSFQFPNPSNPFQTTFPETISVADAMLNQIGEDFVGVKIGDLNASAVANATMTAEERTSGTAIFDLEERSVKAGETFEVKFKSAQQLKGFQFTMLLNGLEMVGLTESDRVNANNFGEFEGATTVSIDGAQEFTLRFQAEKSGKLSQMLGVSGTITRAEAYSNEGRQDIAFRFGGKTIAGVGFELYQNQPNPFVNKTSVGFYLPEAAEATLSIVDESGRVVYQQKGQFAKGENSIQLDRALINTTGLLYYKLETETDSATKKMIQAK